MKLYAQIGHGITEKVQVGLSEAIIDGAIFSPKDLQPVSMKKQISDLRIDYPNADIFVDPQFYVCLFTDSPEMKLGKIRDWQYYKAYRKSELELARNVDESLEKYFSAVQSLDVTAVIAPNIYISQSFDSREAVISKNFIRQAKEVFDTKGDKRLLFTSLIVCREALQDQRGFEEFINDITMLENPPDGFYVVIASRSSEARSDIFHADVLSNWMLLNLSLSVNGFQVINGYSDIVTPFLGVAGASAGATGWWANLRMFSLDRFFPAGGGRPPIKRYLSKLLLNRITYSEKDAIATYVPSIINNLPHDRDYDPEPEGLAEVLQSWEALKSLINDLVIEDAYEEGLENCRQAVIRAEQAYSDIASLGLPLEQKSRDEHIQPLSEALDKFRNIAGL